MLLDWRDIDTILLDMDGTLLDRRFDDHFWLEHVPRRWSAHHKVPLKQAREQLYALFRSQERTLNWTDLDYWSERLGLDIPQLKLEVEHLIAVHPGVMEFLAFCRQHGKQLWLVTNAHSKTLELKMKKTMLGPWFDGIISAHQVGLPKEDPCFWESLQRFVHYNPERSMLGEDTEANLQTAQQYGIRHLIFISRPSSALTPQGSRQYLSVEYFTHLIPPPNSTSVRLGQPEGDISHAKSAL